MYSVYNRVVCKCFSLFCIRETQRFVMTHKGVYFDGVQFICLFVRLTKNPLPDSGPQRFTTL